MYPKANSPFWSKKLQAAAPIKKVKTKAHGTGRRKKQTVEDLLKIDDPKVELESLGRLFMQLIDADSSQGDVTTSHVDA